ncbi:hypothetical protein AAG747_21560 [Rapidithrix thailandica]|uniref:Uncharacterized protein n=1 Tax=Rapidithrix thailandica TaxID=413964 RepID=A0AAW9SAR1_9BACT
MRLHPLVMVFMLIWLGGVGMGCLAVLGSFSKRHNFDSMSLIPFGMLILGYVIVTGGFKYESIKSKKYFAELFEAENEE